MQFAFSTLGCPDLSWEDMIVIAKDLEFDGIEVRGIGNELFVPKARPFSPEHIDSTMNRLNSLNLNIPCLTSACFLFDEKNSEAVIGEVREYIKLASKLGVKYVRVLGDKSPQPEKAAEVTRAADAIGLVIKENLAKLLPFAMQQGVVLLIETNGIYANSKTMLKLIDDVAHPNLQVLWDVHHTFRFYNESVDFTLDKLLKHIRFVHIKDSIMSDGKIKYKMMGKGDVPVAQALSKLSQLGYEGFVSLEWVKRWNMELEDPGIVFSHFINYVLKFK